MSCASEADRPCHDAAAVVRGPQRRWTLLALGALALVPACSGDAARAAGAAASRSQPEGEARRVTLVRVQETALSRVLTVTGTLAADDQVTVSSQVTGALASVSVDLGSEVKRGQPIAQIQATDYQLRVDQAASAVGQARALLGLSGDGTDVTVDIEQTSAVKEAQATLSEAEANATRARSLVAQHLIARADFDSASASLLRAQTALENARETLRNRLALLRQRAAELKLARQQLLDTTVRAPLDGIVQVKQASLGEYVAVGTPLATIVRVNPLRLRAEVAERDAASVQVGQGVVVSVDGQKGSYQGRVARLSPTLVEQSRTLVIEAEIENPGGLRPGGFARAQIAVEPAASVKAVPTGSIVTFAGIEKVISIEQGKAVEKAIVTGRRTETFTEVVSGVELGTPIVVAPGNLQQGESVIVVSGP